MHGLNKVTDRLLSDVYLRLYLSDDALIRWHLIDESSHISSSSRDDHTLSPLPCHEATAHFLSLHRLTQIQSNG